MEIYVCKYALYYNGAQRDNIVSPGLEWLTVSKENNTVVVFVVDSKNPEKLLDLFLQLNKKLFSLTQKYLKLS